MERIRRMVEEIRDIVYNDKLSMFGVRIDVRDKCQEIFDLISRINEEKAES